MFSATFPDEVQESAQEFLAQDYLFVTIGLVGGACSDVRQEFHEVPKFEKRTKLEELMQDPERDPKERTLIFVQTKKNADFLATYLSGEGLPTTSIHGDRQEILIFSTSSFVQRRLLLRRYKMMSFQASAREGGGVVRLPNWGQADLGGHRSRCQRTGYSQRGARYQLRHAGRCGRICSSDR